MRDSPATTALRVERDGPVVRLTMARPESRNAFDEAMVAQIASAFRAFSVDPDVRVVVLAAEGPAFSAGADVGYMRRIGAQNRAANRRDAEQLADMFACVHRCPKPVVARAHGAAYGGAIGLLAAADIVIAADTARFALPEVRLGIAPALIAPYVIRRIGAAAFSAMALTGEPIDALHARDIGLVTLVVPEDALDVTLADRIRALLAGAPEAQAAVKWLAGLVSGDAGSVQGVTVRAIADLRASDEGREGLAAFLERRPASWVAAEGEVPTTSGDRER